MDITYDSRKNEQNIAERGLSFEMVRDFDWARAVIAADTRKDYGEPRYLALGYIGERLHSVAFTPRDGVIRVISLRKANQRERRRYESQT